MKRSFNLSCILLLFFFSSGSLFAQEKSRETKGAEFLKKLEEKGVVKPSDTQITPTPPPETGAPTSYPDITTQALVLVFIALLPFIIMLLTSFMKIVITLSLLRSSLGVQQSPPNMVINGIALILTIYVMFPTGLAMYNKVEHLINDAPKELFTANTAAFTILLVDEAKEPLRDFLIRNSQQKHIDKFYKLTQKTFPDEVKGEITPRDFIVVVPSFITSQLKSAFEVGVLIYLPFFVIDLVTSNILLAMQMMMLSPLSIALPLKLLLLVMLDGWTILVEGLVLSFK